MSSTYRHNARNNDNQKKVAADKTSLWARMKAAKYDETVPKRIIDILAEGKPLGALYKELPVAPSEFDRWKKVYPEIEEAIKVGLDLGRVWWEEQGRDGIKKKVFRDKLYEFMMKNKMSWSSKDADVNVNVHTTAEGVKDVDLRSILEVATQMRGERHANNESVNSDAAVDDK